jgi:phytoene dehydrogenase-like protein
VPRSTDFDSLAMGRRFEVSYHFGLLGKERCDRALRCVDDTMAIAHGKAAVDFEAELDERAVAGVAGAKIANFPRARAAEGRLSSTPLSSVAFTTAEHGGVYGLEASPRRFLSDALHAKTPVTGLYLTGQDVGTAGIVGAMMGGMLSAAALEPKLFARIA